MRYLGIDYGTKRVGIAVSDEDGRIAFPHSVIPNDKQLFSCISATAEEKNIERIILGDARTISGLENPITAEAEKFGRELEQRLRIPVETVFEAWSSIGASEHSPKGIKDDSSAAAFILQRYLDINESKIKEDHP